jgi:hypothetical protein
MTLFQSNNFHTERTSFVFHEISCGYRIKCLVTEYEKKISENYSHSGSKSNKPGQGRIPKLGNTLTSSNLNMLYTKRKNTHIYVDW